MFSSPFADLLPIYYLLVSPLSAGQLFIHEIKEVSEEGTDGAQGRPPQSADYHQTENKQGTKDSGRTSDCPPNCLKEFKIEGLLQEGAITIDN